MSRKQEGFALIELMIVVLIIGVLVAIAVPVYGNMRVHTGKRSCQANLRTIAGAVEQYRADPGGATQMPTSVQDLVDRGVLRVEPQCPAGGTYAFTVETPNTMESNVEVTCSQAAALGHRN